MEDLINRACLSVKSCGKLNDEVTTLLSQVKNKINRHNNTIQRQIRYMLSSVMYRDSECDYRLGAASIRGLSYQFRCYLKSSKRELYNLMHDFLYINTIGDTLTGDIKSLIKDLDEQVDNVFDNYDNTNFALMSEQGIESLISRVKLFGEQIINFCSYDSESCIRLFGESLIHVGKYIEEDGQCVGSEKKGRNAMKAGGMLLNAYDESDSTESKHYYSLLDKLITQNKATAYNTGMWGNDVEVTFNDSLRTRIDKARDVFYNQERRRKSSAWNNITKLVGRDENSLVPAIDRWTD